LATHWYETVRMQSPAMLITVVSLAHSTNKACFCPRCAYLEAPEKKRHCAGREGCSCHQSSYSFLKSARVPKIIKHQMCGNLLVKEHSAVRERISLHQYSHFCLMSSQMTNDQISCPPCQICRVGQNRLYTPCMTVYWKGSLPKIPHIHHIIMLLATLQIC